MWAAVWTLFFNFFEALKMQKAGKCFKKLGTTWNKNNVQSHDQR